jgi:holliday junction DNA helicase RuvA
MVLELRDKLPPTAGAAEHAHPTMSGVEEDVLSALINLGYQRPAAEKVVASILKDGAAKAEASFDSLFRGALAQLSK